MRAHQIFHSGHVINHQQGGDWIKPTTDVSITPTADVGITSTLKVEVSPKPTQWKCYVGNTSTTVPIQYNPFLFEVWSTTMNNVISCSFLGC